MAPARGGVIGGDSRTGVIAVLRQLIQSRYQPEQKFLDLGNMMSDPMLNSSGQRVQGFTPESKLGGVICKMIGELCPDVCGAGINALGVNVDLTLNSDIKKLFPTIQVLDMQPVVGDITFAVDALSVELPLPTKPGFMDSPATAQTVDRNLERQKDGGMVGHILKKVGCLNFCCVGKRIATLARGNVEVIRAFQKIPKTAHPPYPSAAYLVEGFQTGTGDSLTMFILVHGEFRECK
ncbi:unnamed protein product [Sphagnum tenellum]